MKAKENPVFTIQCKKCGRKPKPIKGSITDNRKAFKDKPCTKCGGKLTITGNKPAKSDSKPRKKASVKKNPPKKATKKPAKNEDVKKHPFKTSTKIWNRDKVMQFINNCTATSNKALTSILKDIHKLHGSAPHYDSVREWIRESENSEDEEERALSYRYAHAKGDQADFLVEEMIDIADGSQYKEEIDKLMDALAKCPVTDTDQRDIIKMQISIAHQSSKELTNRDRLKVDTRKWIASKLKKKKYGDRTELASDPENPVNANLSIAVEFVDGSVGKRDD